MTYNFDLRSLNTLSRNGQGTLLCPKRQEKGGRLDADGIQNLLERSHSDNSGLMVCFMISLDDLTLYKKAGDAKLKVATSVTRDFGWHLEVSSRKFEPNKLGDRFILC